MTNTMKRCRLSASYSTRSRTTIVQPVIAETPPAVVLQRLIIGDWISQTVQVAAKLGLADLLGDGPRTSKKAKLLLVEMVAPEGNSPSFTKLLDIKMLACFGGRERAESEYRDLLSSNGLRVSRVLPTSTPASIIEAEAV